MSSKFPALLPKVWTQELNAEGVAIYSLYYGVPEGQVHLLPVGTTFDMIFSPTPYQRQPHWNKTRFRVIMTRDKYGKHKNKQTRKYRQVAERDLTPAEIEEIETMITEWKEGNI
jgi:hypothetical protein